MEKISLKLAFVVLLVFCTYHPEEMVAEARYRVISVHCEQVSDCGISACGLCKTCICKDSLCACEEDDFPPVSAVNAFLGHQ